MPSASADAFDGAAELLRAWREGLQPDPDLTVSAWADAHRILSPRGSSEAGRWRTSRTPYLREIMDALSPRHPAQRVVFMKGSQIGASEGGCPDPSKFRSRFFRFALQYNCLDKDNNRCRPN
jgi:hypothetical protein